MTAYATAQGDEKFTYASDDQPALRRTLIRAVEKLGGQRRLKRLYEQRNDARLAHETFFDVALRLLAIDVRFDPAALARIPATGPVLFTANHPYGVLDGLVLTSLAGKARPDVKLLAHSALCRVPEARAHLLPVDFAETEVAQRNNLATRQEAIRSLRSGGAVAIFPGGGVSTSPTLTGRAAYDLPWAPFTAKLIMAARPTVVPIYFAGQNSRLFQLASHLSLTLRLSLIFRETARRIGDQLEVAVGEPIPYEELAPFGDRTTILDEIRRRTYALSRQADDWKQCGVIGATARKALREPA